VYSLGVVAFECLTGARPFDGASQVAIALAHINRPPPPLPAHVPPAVRLLVERALAKDPADRFPDGGAFAEAIRRVAAGGTLAAAPAPVVGPRTMPTQVVAGGAVAGGALAAGAATGTGLADSRTQVIPATGPGAVAGGPPTGPAGPMPPLQAPPEEDEWDAGDEAPRSGRARWIWLSAAVVLLLLLAGGTWFLLADGNRGSGGTSAETSTSRSSAAPTGLQLDAAAFVGRPADEVQAELQAAGLVVRQEDADDDVLASAGQSLDAGDVAGLDPSSGFAAPGTEVVLLVAKDAFSPEDQAEETTEAPPTTEAPTSTRATQTSEAPTTEPPTTAATTTEAPTTSLPGSEEPTTSAPVDTGAGDQAGGTG
jgi:serine/threonine-protein kinase